MKLFQATLLTVSMVALTACGGGSDSNATQTNGTQIGDPVTGTFVDAPVQGVSVYVDNKKTDTTNAKGQFTYKKGDTVTFKLGQVTLGSKKDPQTVTPADLTTNKNAINNILVLLQSLDSDNNPENGITIAPAVLANLTTKVNLSDDDTDLDDIKKDLRTQISTWVEVKKAQAHFAKALKNKTPNDNVKQAVNGFVGYWQQACDDGEIKVHRVKKVNATTIRVIEGIEREYKNKNCTGSYKEDRDDDVETFTILGVVVKDGKTLLNLVDSDDDDDDNNDIKTFELSKNTLKADGKTFVRVSGLAFKAVKDKDDNKDDKDDDRDDKDKDDKDDDKKDRDDKDKDDKDDKKDDDS